MGIPRRFAGLGFALAIACANVPDALAAGVQLGFAGLGASAAGESLRGMLRIEVRNLTGVEMRDVEVGLAHPGLDLLDRPNLRIDAIPAGQARTIVTGYLFNTRSDEPLIWRVQYEQNGMRREERLLGEAQEGGAQ